jgi:hypothetical protein
MFSLVALISSPSPGYSLNRAQRHDHTYPPDGTFNIGRGIPVRADHVKIPLPQNEYV